MALKTVIAVLAVLSRVSAQIGIKNKDGSVVVTTGGDAGQLCLANGNDTTCLSAVGPESPATKSQLDEAEAALDVRVQGLETDLTAKVDNMKVYIDAQCKWGFEFKNDAGKCVPIKECEVGVNYEAVRATSNTNRECQSVTTCTNAEFELLKPGYSYDRKCLAATECRAEEFILIEKTDVSDRTCAQIAKCTDAEYETSAPATNKDRVCETITVCDLKTQWLVKEATKTSNAKCNPLYLSNNPGDGATKARPANSCKSAYDVREGDTPGQLFSPAVWVKTGSVVATKGCIGTYPNFKEINDGQTIATKTTGTCAELFSAFGPGVAPFNTIGDGKTLLVYTSEYSAATVGSAKAGTMTCMNDRGAGVQLPAGGRLLKALNDGTMSGMKKSDIVFWLDTIHAPPEKRDKSITDFVNGQKFEWYSQWNRPFEFRQDKTAFHNMIYFNGYGYLRRANSDLNAFGLPNSDKDRTLFGWAKPSKEQGWINHLMHYGRTSCGGAYALGYTHYYGKHWVGAHRWCGGNGFQGANWQQKGYVFVGSMLKNSQLKTFTVTTVNGTPKLTWGTGSINNQHYTRTDAASADRNSGYFRIGSRISDWEWFYGGASSVGVAKIAMTDAQIIAMYTETLEWRNKRD